MTISLGKDDSKKCELINFYIYLLCTRPECPVYVLKLETENFIEILIRQYWL